MNATKSSGRFRRAGFTLVELLVVIGLMALLGTISIGGYFAAARGMKTRGVVQDTITFLRQAQQTCVIDNVPVAVLFMNRYQGDEAQGADVYGTAIAVKMAGRISSVIGSTLVDEFADWDRTYDTKAGKSSDEQGVRLYNMRAIVKSGSKIESISSLANGWVTSVRMSAQDDEVMLSAGGGGMTVKNWIAKYGRSSSKTLPGTKNNDLRWGFTVKSGLGASAWHAGDAYGMEIGTFDLPKGYIFGSALPSDKQGGLSSATPASVVFRPSKASDGSSVPGMGTTLAISSVGMGEDSKGVEKIYDITDSQLKDQK